MKKILIGLFVAVALLVGADVSQAAIATTGFVIDIAPIEALLAVAVVAMGALYVVRKFVKTGNRL